MEPPDIDKKIRKWLRQGRLFFKKHALTRMIERNITILDVEQALQNSEIVKTYPDDKPLKSVLILGCTENQRPVHMVVAPDDKSEVIWVITVYEPDPEKWEKDLKRRK